MNREWLVVVAICLIVVAGALIGIYIHSGIVNEESEADSETEVTDATETSEVIEETVETEPTETTAEVNEETTETLVEAVYIPETEPVVTEPPTEPAPTNPPETVPPTEAPTEPIPEVTDAPTIEETEPAEEATEPTDIPEETEVMSPDGNEETEATSPEYSAEVEMLACVIYQEAGGDAYCDTCRRRVADVVLNRVDSASFPNTIYEVLTQEGQYGRFHWTGIIWPERAKYESEAHAVERAYRIAQEVLNGQHSELYGNRYVWQAGFIQGYDNVYCCGHYFGKG